VISTKAKEAMSSVPLSKGTQSWGMGVTRRLRISLHLVVKGVPLLCFLCSRHFSCDG
jgi:hypothetical protein